MADNSILIRATWRLLCWTRVATCTRCVGWSVLPLETVVTEEHLHCCLLLPVTLLITNTDTTTRIETEEQTCM